MISKPDLDIWESTLQEELEGLRYCQDQVSADKSIPQPIKIRFKEIITSLNDSIHQVLAKCRQLRSESISSTGFSKRAERLQIEYQNVLHNIEKLLKTVNVHKSPRYRRETYTSQSKSPKVKSSKSATTLSVDRKDDKQTLGQITQELKEMKDALRRVKHKVEKHGHETYEAELREARSENDKLWARLHSMQEEQTRLIQLVQTLSDRVSLLQPKSPESEEPTPKLLTKRTGEAEDLLKH